MEPQRLLMPNGWYDPVYEREQRRHPLVQIWEAQQREEQAAWQAAWQEAQEAEIAERAAWQASFLADKIAAEAKVFDDYGLTFERIRELVACEDVDAVGQPANRKDVAVLHAWVVSLHGGGVSLRKIGAKYGIDPESLRQWVVRAEQSLADLKAAKEAAVMERRREREAYRFRNGYANKSGRTYPHVAEAFTDEYLAGGVTYKQLAEKYGLSSERIRQLIARVKKRRG
jgi:DNA-directed RNA polymerase sigma subunit (sigma70/sigma32)